MNSKPPHPPPHPPQHQPTTQQPPLSQPLRAVALEQAIYGRLRGSGSAKRLFLCDALDMELGSPPWLCTLLAAPPLFPYPMPRHPHEFERFVWEFSIPLSPLFQEIHSDSRTTLRSLRVSCVALHDHPFKPPKLKVLNPEPVWCPVLGADGLVGQPRLVLNASNAMWAPALTPLEYVAGLHVCWNDWTLGRIVKQPTVQCAESLTAFRKHAGLEPLTPDRLKAICDELQAMLSAGLSRCLALSPSFLFSVW